MEEMIKALDNALNELRKEKQRKFDQTVELILNLQKFDLKKNQINIFIKLPYKIKEKKIAAFFEVKNSQIDTITPDQFKNYSDKNKIKKLVKNYDFFISQASVMPRVAMTFGKVLGPAGKMPSPQIGIITNVDEKAISELKQKINNSLRIRAKEASIKVPIGKQSMKNQEIIENILTVYNSMINALSKKKENIKNLEIKFTMTKPIKIKIK